MRFVLTTILVFLAAGSIFGQYDVQLTPACFNTSFDDFGTRKIGDKLYVLSASKDPCEDIMMDPYTKKPYSDLYEVEGCKTKDAKLVSAETKGLLNVNSCYFDGPISSNAAGNLLFFTNNFGSNEYEKLTIHYSTKNEKGEWEAVGFCSVSPEDEEEEVNSIEEVEGSNAHKLNKLYVLPSQQGKGTGAQAIGAAANKYTTPTPQTQHLAHPLRRHQAAHHAGRGQHHQQIDRHVHAERDQPDPDRRAGVLARIERRCQHLHQQEGRHRDGLGHQAPAGHADIGRIEPAVLEQGRQQRLGAQDQAGAGRQADQQAEPEAPVQPLRVAVRIGFGMAAGQVRQDHRADGHAEHAQREFQQAVAVIQPGDAAVDQVRRRHGIDGVQDTRHTHQAAERVGQERGTDDRRRQER